MEKTISKSEEFIKLCKEYEVDPDSIPEITSFEQACEFRKMDPTTCLPDISMFPADHQQALTATAKMYIIAEALNQDADGECWKPDWNNGDERKWLPWFDMEVDKNNPSGFRFVRLVLRLRGLRARPAAPGFAIAIQISAGLPVNIFFPCTKR
jgi:hypothetical protein